jgi:hypothetical protein
MKIIKFKLIPFFILGFFTAFTQKFEVEFLIDRTYNKVTLNTILESMNLLSSIDEDYLTIKMIAAAETESKIKHDNNKEGKELMECHVVLMAGVLCDPCNRLQKGIKSIKSPGVVKVFAQTTDNDFGTCDMKVQDYDAISANEDLAAIIKAEKEKAKKLKVDYKVLIWIPSNETVTIDLVVSTNERKVDFGTEITFTAKTNSKEKTSVIMLVNGEEIEECKESGSVKISRVLPLVKAIEIIEPTIVTLVRKGCGNPKKVTFELNRNCEEIETVVHDIWYDSKSIGPLGTKTSASQNLDNNAFTIIKLVDNKLYMVVINKQCGVRSYRAELVDIQTNVEYKFNLKKSSDQSGIHLSSGDMEDYIVYTLDQNIMKSQGIIHCDDDTEPKYRMRIVPVEAINDDLKVKGYESKWEVVKFQKCN